MPSQLEVYVERNRWMRGDTDNLMKLYDAIINKYDIVGCILLKVGYSLGDLNGLRFPGPLSPDRRQPLPSPCEWMVSRAGVTTDACLEIIHLNDADMPGPEREQALARKVREHSGSRITLQFVDEIPIERSTSNIYKMQRLGITWEEFERRARANGVNLSQAYLTAERLYIRSITEERDRNAMQVHTMCRPRSSSPTWWQVPVATSSSDITFTTNATVAAPVYTLTEEQIQQLRQIEEAQRRMDSELAEPNDPDWLDDMFDEPIEEEGDGNQ